MFGQFASNHHLVNIPSVVRFRHSLIVADVYCLALASIHSSLFASLHPLISSRLASIAEEIQERHLPNTPSDQVSMGRLTLQHELVCQPSSLYPDQCSSDIHPQGLQTPAQVENLRSNLEGARQSNIDDVDSEGSDVPATARPPLSSNAAILSFFAWQPQHPSDRPSPGPAADILRCQLCARRVGLWQYRSRVVGEEDGGSRNGSKRLDVVASHRDYCPVRTIAVNSGHSDAPWWTESPLLCDDEGWRKTFGSTGSPDVFTSANGMDTLHSSVKASLKRIVVDTSSRP